MIFEECFLHIYQSVRLVSDHVRLLCAFIQAIFFIAVFSVLLTVSTETSSLLVLSAAFQFFAISGLLLSKESEYGEHFLPIPFIPKQNALKNAHAPHKCGKDHCDVYYPSYYHKPELNSITMKLLILSSLARLCVVLISGGYRPKDESGRYMFQSLDVGSIILLLWKIFLYKLQSMQHVYEWLQSILLSIICFCLGLSCHVHLVRNLYFDAIWAGAIFLDTIVLMPQIHAISGQRFRSGGKFYHTGVKQNDQFILFYWCSRACSTLFWGTVYVTIGWNPMDHSRMTVPIIFLCHIIQIILATDAFILHACKRYAELNYKSAVDWFEESILYAL